MEYRAARSGIQTGDAIFFVRMTLRDCRGLSAFGGYISNAVICAAQWRNSGNFDGFHEFCHIGVAVRNNSTDEALLAEFTAQRNDMGHGGLRLVRLSDRVAEYPSAVVWVPLKPEISDAVKLHNGHTVQNWLSQHRDDAYNYFGLLAPEARLYRGTRNPGSMFCSEAAVHFWQYLDVLPKERRRMVGKRIVTDNIEPQFFSPADVARLCILNWDSAQVLA